LIADEVKKGKCFAFGYVWNENVLCVDFKGTKNRNLDSFVCIFEIILMKIFK